MSPSLHQRSFLTGSWPAPDGWGGLVALAIGQDIEDLDLLQTSDKNGEPAPERDTAHDSSPRTTSISVKNEAPTEGARVGQKPVQSPSRSTDEKARWVAFISYSWRDEQAYDGLIHKMAQKLSMRLDLNKTIKSETPPFIPDVTFSEVITPNEIPVFIAVISSAWFNSEVCLSECEQFLIRAHGTEYDPAHWRPPRPDRGLFLPVTLEDTMTLKKSYGTRKMEDLFFGPGIHVYDLRAGWFDPNEFRRIITELKNEISRWWNNRTPDK